MSPILKYILACLTCQCWCPFYCFLNSYIRTCNLCIDTITRGKNVVFKILACLFFWCCFGIIECIFCLMGIVYLFQGPCQSFANSGDIRQGYLNLVKGDSYPIEDSVKSVVQGFFC